jgi:hypothetical protein
MGETDEDGGETFSRCQTLSHFSVDERTQLDDSTTPRLRRVSIFHKYFKLTELRDLRFQFESRGGQVIEPLPEHAVHCHDDHRHRHRCSQQQREIP